MRAIPHHHYPFARRRQIRAASRFRFPLIVKLEDKRRIAPQDLADFLSAYLQIRNRTILRIIRYSPADRGLKIVVPLRWCAAYNYFSHKLTILKKGAHRSSGRWLDYGIRSIAHHWIPDSNLSACILLLSNQRFLSGRSLPSL